MHFINYYRREVKKSLGIRQFWKILHFSTLTIRKKQLKRHIKIYYFNFFHLVPLIEESPIYSTKYIWSTQHYLQFAHINSDTYSVVSLCHKTQDIANTIILWWLYVNTDNKRRLTSIIFALWVLLFSPWPEPYPLCCRQMQHVNQSLAPFYQ